MIRVVRQAFLSYTSGRRIIVNVSQSFYNRCINTGGRDDDESNIEDFIEASINDPQVMSGLTPYPPSGSGNQSAKKQLEMQQRKMKKDAIIKNKLRKLHNLNLPLLTWAAKAQIKHLNQSDPIYWTPRMLSKSFPASFYEIVEILKDNRLPVNDDEIHCHDKMIHQNWLMLKEAKLKLMEGADVDPKLRRSVESRLLDNIRNAAGSKLLSNPDIKLMLLTQEIIAEQNKPHTDRLFSSLLDNDDKNVTTVKQESKFYHIKLEDDNVIGLLDELSHNVHSSQLTSDNTNIIDSGDVNINKYGDEHVYRTSEYEEKQDGDISARNKDFKKQTNDGEYKHHKL